MKNQVQPKTDTNDRQEKLELTSLFLLKVGASFAVSRKQFYFVICGFLTDFPQLTNLFRIFSDKFAKVVSHFRPVPNVHLHHDFIISCTSDATIM